MGAQRRHRWRPDADLDRPHRHRRRRHHGMGYRARRGRHHGRPLRPHARRSTKARGKSGPRRSVIPARRSPCGRNWRRPSAALSGTPARTNTNSPRTETERLVKAADIVTLARTGVERDYRGDVIDAHAPEMPTRFAKQLAQMLRGADRDRHAAASAMRSPCAAPAIAILPLRREILLDLAEHPWSRVRATSQADRTPALHRPPRTGSAAHAAACCIATRPRKRTRTARSTPSFSMVLPMTSTSGRCWRCPEKVSGKVSEERFGEI